MNKGYRFIDWCVQIYLAVVALLILVFHGDRVPHWQALVVGHVLCMALCHGIVKLHAAYQHNRLLDILRHFYPIILYTAFYTETGALNQMFVSGYLDKLFMDIDQWLFGMQPSIRFMEKLPYLPVSEIFYASYFSYYIMIVGVGAIFYFRDKRRFFHYVSIVSFVFYVCYLIYIFLPVVGPRVFWAEVHGFPEQQSLGFYPLRFPQTLQEGPFFQIMKFIYDHFEAHGAAFPSSHVAVALCCAYFTWRFMPRIRYAHLVIVILLCGATVYCRYHYLIDVFAGILTALALIPLGEWLYRKCEPALSQDDEKVSSITG